MSTLDQAVASYNAVGCELLQAVAQVHAHSMEPAWVCEACEHGAHGVRTGAETVFRCACNCHQS